MESERHVTQGAVDVAHVVKKDALNVVSDERKPQFYIVDEKRISP